MSEVLSDLVDLISLLCCPDDGKALFLESHGLVCSQCLRKFQIDDNVIDLRVSSSASIGKKDEVERKYYEIYQNLFEIGSLGKNNGPFGVESRSISPGFLLETLTFLKTRISRNQVVCDIGGGSGDYSVELASHCKLVLHCDLDLDGIQIARRRATAKHLDNIFFIWCDYFSLPFSPTSVDFIYTIDVLERGPEHDRRLLGEIKKILKLGGQICFDCHTKERSNLTGVSLSSDRYSRQEMLHLANEFSLQVEDLSGTGFIPQIRIWSINQYRFLNFFAKALRFPPARWIASCRSV